MNDRRTSATVADEICTYVRDLHEDIGAVIIIMRAGDRRGNGFAVQSRPEMQEHLAEILERIAAAIQEGRGCPLVLAEQELGRPAQDWP